MDSHAPSERRAAPAATYAARWLTAPAVVALWVAGCRMGDLLSPGTPANVSGNPSAPADRLAFVRQPGGAMALAPIDPPIEVAALDDEGRPATGFTGAITLTLDENPGNARLTGTTTVRARAGVATFSDVALDRAGEGYRLAASTADASSARSEPFDVRSPPGVPARLVQVDGDGQRDSISAPLGTAYVVRVVDGAGAPVAGVTIRWEADPGSGVIVPGVTITDAAGEATARHTLGPAAGTQRVQAWVHGAAGLRVTFTATATHGAPVRLAFTVQPSDVEEDERIRPAVEVTIYDRLGNVATGVRDEVRMSLVLFSGSLFARLRGGTERRPDDGVAVFDDLRIDRSGTAFRLRAHLGGIAVDSNPFAVHDD
jgi:hypothetical protein